jgi:hypothetical protein
VALSLPRERSCNGMYLVDLRLATTASDLELWESRFIDKRHSGQTTEVQLMNH